MQNKLIALCTIALVIPLASCKTTGIGGTENSPCVAEAGKEPAWRAIGWSSKDTKETITEVKANNARRAAWCEN